MSLWDIFFRVAVVALVGVLLSLGLAWVISPGVGR